MSTYYVEIDGFTVYATQSHSVAVETLEDAKVHWPDSKDFRITVVGHLHSYDVEDDDRKQGRGGPKTSDLPIAQLYQDFCQPLPFPLNTDGPRPILLCLSVSPLAIYSPAYAFALIDRAPLRPCMITSKYHYQGGFPNDL